jgi:hypothetical protein
MAKKNNTELVASDESQEIKITPEIQKSIDDLIFQQKRLNTDKEAYGEAVAAIAEKLGVKSGVLSTRVSMIIKEEEKGGEVKSKTQHINFVEEYFTMKGNTEYK